MDKKGGLTRKEQIEHDKKEIERLQNRIKQNQFQYAGSQFNYRSGVPPIQLTDKTFNITFRHTLGYLNYFMLFENFWYQFSRDMNYEDLPQRFTIDLFNELGSIYSRAGNFLPLILCPIIDVKSSYNAIVARSIDFRNGLINAIALKDGINT